MGCKVEKIVLDNGETSDLFRDLSYQLSQSRALESYLHVKNDEAAFKALYGENSQGEVNADNMIGTPKFKLEGFNTYQEQSDTMDFLATAFIDTLKGMSATKSNSTIGGIDFSGLVSNPTTVPMAMQLTRERLQSQLVGKEHLIKNQRAIALRKQAILNMPSYLANKKGLGPLGFKLQDYGIHIGVRETSNEVENRFEDAWENNEHADVEESLIKYERIYDMDLLESSVSNTILDNVKAYLKSKKRLHSSYTFKQGIPGATHYQASTLSSTRPARYEVVVGKLYGVLKGMQSPDQMLSRLESAVKTSPELAPIYFDLLAEAKSPVKVTIDGKLTKYKPIATALYSTFAKQDYNMFSVVEDNGDVVFYAANASSMQSTIQNKWAEDIIEVQKYYKENDKESKQEVAKMKTFLSKKGIVNAINKKDSTGNDAPNSIELNTASTFFNAAGFKNVTGADLKNLLAYVKANKAKFSSKVTKTNYDVLNFFMNSLVAGTIKGDSIFGMDPSVVAIRKQDKYGEKRALAALSSVLATRSSDISVGAFYSNRGSMVHPINQGSEAQDIFFRLSDPAVREAYLKDPIYASNSILATLNHETHSSLFDVTTMDVLSDNSKAASGITYGQLSSFDALTTRLNGYFGSAKPGYFYAFSPTQADRGKLQALFMPKKDVRESGEAAPLFVRGVMQDGEIKDWLEGQVRGELSRIARSKNDKVSYTNYTGKNATRFNLFTDLNEKLNLEKLIDTRSSIESYVAEAMTHIPEIFKSIIAEDMAFMVDNNVVAKTAEGFMPTRESQKILSKKLGKGKKITHSNMENFLANNFITTYDQTLLYMGDMAYYKSKGNTPQGVYTNQLADLNKRFGLPFTPGAKLAIGSAYGLSPTANIKIISEAKVDSDWYEVYQNITNSEKYAGIELADGAGFVSLQRYRSLMMAQGLHSDELLKYIDEQIAWKQGMPIPTTKTKLEVLKGFYFKVQEGKNAGVMVPFNMKYSIMPVIPSYFEEKINGKDKFPGMAAISRELRRTSTTKSPAADEIVLESAVKVGHSEVIQSLEELTDGAHTVVSNDAYRFPQSSPSQDKYEDRFGSQMRKIITGNFNTSAPLKVGVERMDASKALSGYNEAISTLVNIAGEKVYRDFLAGEQINEPELVKKLLTDLSNNKNNNAEYYTEALETINDANQRLLPLSYPTIKYKLDSLINAAFRNSVTKMKLPGHSAVQVTSLGTKELVTGKGISVGSDLKFIRIKGISKESALKLAKQYKAGDKNAFDGFETEPAEVRITPKFFENNIKNIAKKKIDVKAIDTQVAEFIKGLPSFFDAGAKGRAADNFRASITQLAVDKEAARLRAMIQTNGKYDISKVRKAGLADIVLYRIPTQLKNSILHATILDFLDPAMGGTIQVPSEIVDQSGSDFDIDKVFIEMTSFREAQGGLEGIPYRDSLGNIDVSSQEKAKAYIMDFHKSILSSTSYLAEVLSPNNTQMLTDLANKINPAQAITSSWGSVSAQEIFRINNKAGKELIAISSVASVAHAVAKHIGSNVLRDINIGGKIIKKFGDEYSTATTKSGEAIRISQEIEQIQNAAMDNAKEPLLGRLNIDSFTASSVLLMLSGGLGLEYATAIVNAPIIKDLAKAYPVFSRKYSNAQALKKAQKFVEKKYGIKKRSQVKLQNYTKEIATAGLNPMTIEDSAGALKVFLEIKEHGDDFSTFQTTMNFDSKGTPSTVAELLDKYIKLAGVSGTLAHSREHSIEVLHKKSDNPQDTVYGSTREVLAAVILNSKKIRLSNDQKSYIHTENGKSTTLRRLSEYVGNGIDKSKMKQSQLDALEESNTAGTIIDRSIRDYFITGKIVNDGSIAPSAVKALESIATRLKDHFKQTGETVITDQKYLKVFDLKLGVAGEMDLLTVDKKGLVRIYDTKSVKNATVKDYMQNTKASALTAQDYIDDRFEKRGAQLNGYRGLLRNMIGLSAVELNIIPIPITYTEGGSYIQSVRESDNLFEFHKTVEDAIIDTRVFETVKNERVLAKLRKDTGDIKFGVDKDLYAASYLSNMEEKSIHYPLSVNRKVSTNASVQMQSVQAEAIEALGYMTQKQLSKLSTSYDTYLATNSTASTKLKTSLSRRMATKEHLSLTDGTSSEATANILSDYRRAIKNINGIENAFTENLSIVTHKGRKFVTFNNTVAKGLTGEAKKEMMFFFEDLMDAPKSSLEYKLAKSLADYAIIHYGFARGFNSFMEFIPPRAHEEFMGSKSGDSKVTLPNFFREIYKNFDNTEDFHTPSDFVTMFVQNNWNSLGLIQEQLFIGDTMNIAWEQELLQRSGKYPPKFILLNTGSELELQMLTKGSYAPIAKRGVDGFVVEYNDGDSLYNDVPSSNTSGDVQKNLTSDENKTILNNINNTSVRNVINKAGDFNAMTFTDAAQVRAHNINIMKTLKAANFTAEETAFVENQLEEVVLDAVSNYKTAVRRNSGVTFDSLVKNGFEDVIEFTLESNFKLTNKILTC